MSIGTRIRQSLQSGHHVTTTDAHKRDPCDRLPTVAGFQLESTAIADGETLPVDQRSGIFGAGGSDISPDLSWSGFPEETQSFIVTMYDADAPTPSGFWHWMVINIPGSVTSLQTGAGDGDETLPDRATHLANDAGLRRYLGAAPPPGDPPHRLFVVASALDVADAGLPDGATPALASFQTLAHTIWRATLVPVYGARMIGRLGGERGAQDQGLHRRDGCSLARPWSRERRLRYLVEEQTRAR